MSRPLRIGIAGTGFVGRLHARAARLAGARLIGVAASTPSRGAAAAQALGAERAFASADELAVARDVDVVHVCTPNHLHVPLVRAALAAGKHVLCEKPLALDSEGARSLRDAAAAADRVGAVPFVYRYYPTAREARERVAAGLAGPIRLVHGSYLQDWLGRPADDNWRVQEALGGRSRAFADIGSHWCDLAEFVSGHRITRVSASTVIAIPERAAGVARRSFASDPDGDGDGVATAARRVTTEDAVVAQFATDRGALGSLVVSQVSPGRKNRLWLEVDGAREALAFDQEEPETLWCGSRERVHLLRRDPEALSAAAARLAVHPAGHPQGYTDCFDAFVADAYAAIRTGDRDDALPTFSDGVRAAEITDAVLRSASEGGWVAVTEPAQESERVVVDRGSVPWPT